MTLCKIQIVNNRKKKKNNIHDLCATCKLLTTMLHVKKKQGCMKKGQQTILY